MGRVLSTAFCVALLAAATGAFALTEGAKTTLSPIYGTKIDKIFSPTCDPRICGKRVADIVFKLRGRERLEVWIERGSSRVRTLVNGRVFPRGGVHLVFNGRSDAGALLPDGTYLPVVRLLGDHRTITLPNPIVLDTHAPRVVRAPHDLHALIAPGAVGRPQDVLIPYTLSGHAHAILFANGHRVVFTYREPPRGALEWRGKIAGARVGAGTYTLSIAAQDEAGNRSRPLRCATVTVRYLVLAASRVRVAPRAHFSVRVAIGPARLSWLFAGAHHSGSTRVIHLRAPRRRGRYRLYVTGGGHEAAVLVVVR